MYYLDFVLAETLKAKKKKREVGPFEPYNSKEKMRHKAFVSMTVRRRKILLLFLATALALLLVHRRLLPQYVFKMAPAPGHSLGCDLRNAVIKRSKNTYGQESPLLSLT